MIYTAISITQTILDVIGEPIESIATCSDIRGLAFVTVAGGRIAIYNLELNQAMRKRWDNLEAARSFAIAKLCTPHVIVTGGAQ